MCRAGPRVCVSVWCACAMCFLPGFGVTNVSLLGRPWFSGGELASGKWAASCELLCHYIHGHLRALC